MNRKQIRGAAVMLVLMMLAAGCGGKTEKPAETSAAAEQTAETTAEGQSAESTPAGETSAEETTAEETTEPVPLVVTKHKEDGTHMVTAGALTISVPTTFEGLEMEGAEFQGDQELVRSGKMAPEDITEQTISDHLYTRGQPDVDLLIRTSGEMRLSNFLLFQCAYAEFLFPKTLWPDFSVRLYDEALSAFGNRNRRFGART